MKKVKKKTDQEKRVIKQAKKYNLSVLVIVLVVLFIVSWIVELE